jgi:hypothetical protein
VTPSRNIRIPERRWRLGLERARRQGTTLSDKVNRWIDADLDGRLEILEAGQPEARSQELAAGSV